MKTPKIRWVAGRGLAALYVAAAVGTAAHAGDRPRDNIALGRYLVQTTGCNDCHSLGYTQHGGKTPEATWLTGDSLGWRGPWGTTYPSKYEPTSAPDAAAQLHARFMRRGTREAR